MNFPTIQELNKSIYTESYYHFFVEAVKVLEPQTVLQENWHLQYLCQDLQDMITRAGNRQSKTKDLVINIPPRSMKSMIATVCLNAWAWISYPHLSFITCSYNGALAIEHCQKTRTLIESDWYQSYFSDSFKLVRDQNQKSNFKNDKSGQRQISSTGSSATGKGGDVIIFDDILNPTLAKSELGRDTMREYYFNTMYSRLNNTKTGIRIIVEQRLHEDDLTGLLKAKGGYNHICLPIIENDNILPTAAKDNYANGFLFQNRFDQNTIDDLKINLGSQEFATQYLQQPAPDTGLIIQQEWLRYRFNTLDLPKDIPRHFMSDTAYGNNNESDYCATLCYSIHNNNAYIWSMFHQKLPFDKYIPAHKSYLEANNYTNQSKDYFEPKATGLSVIQVLKSEGINAIATDNPTDSKLVRVQSITPILEAGRVFFLNGVDWSDLIHECKTFPNAKNDDLVDVLTGVCQGMSKGLAPPPTDQTVEIPYTPAPFYDNKDNSTFYDGTDNETYFYDNHQTF